MKTKDLVLASLLLALGLVLHSITPAILGGVKPDFLLAMMFIAIITQPKTSNVMLIAVVSGILAAITTGFPGGQIPNIVDKLVTALFFYIILLVLKSNLNLVSVSILSFCATIVSGLVFLGSAQLMVGLPAPFLALVSVVVLPTALANAVVCTVLYKTMIMIKKPLIQI